MYRKLIFHFIVRLNPINKIFPILERSVISIHYTHMHYLPLYSRDLGMKKIVLTVLTGEL